MPELRHLKIAWLWVRHEAKASAPVVDEHALHGERVKGDVQALIVAHRENVMLHG